MPISLLRLALAATILATGAVAPAVAHVDAVDAQVQKLTEQKPSLVLDARDLDDVARETARPTEWARKLRRCSRRGRRRFCDGPRMVPVASPEATARAEALGLGTTQAASRVLVSRPLPEWVEAVGGEVPSDLLWPVPDGRRGRGFGRVRRSELRHINHDGVDMPAPVGTPVVAAADGLVAYADNGIRGYGNLVLLVHADGTATVYAHLSAAYVPAGERVGRGQVIGEVGNTGLSYAPHLHFEWHARGRARNPARRLAGVPESPRAAPRRGEGHAHGALLATL